MTVDSAVRSIRIATTLNERLGAIMREAEAHQTVAELELRIGEAQQVYPEIWRHLDDARAALGQRGIAAPGYDVIRATEPRGQLAVDDIESTEGINPLSLAFGQLQYVQTKTARFNLAGHDKAQRACDALMRAMPEIDWRAVAHAEDAEIAAMGSLTSTKWRQVALVVAVLVGMALVYRMFG